MSPEGKQPKPEKAIDEQRATDTSKGLPEDAQIPSVEHRDRIHGLLEVVANPSTVQSEAGKPVEPPKEKLSYKEKAMRMAQEEKMAIQEILKAAKGDPALIVAHQDRLKNMDNIQLFEVLSIHFHSTFNEARYWVEKGLAYNPKSKWKIRFQAGFLYIKRKGVEYKLVPFRHEVFNKETKILESKPAFQFIKVVTRDGGYPIELKKRGSSGSGPDEYDDWADRNSDNNKD